MSDDTVPDSIASALEPDERSEVTEEYGETLDMLLGLAHHRQNPLPIAHAVAVEDEREPGVITFIFSVDTDAVSSHAFELSVEEDLADAIEEGDDSDESPANVVDRFTATVRTVEESIWQEAVNLE